MGCGNIESCNITYMNWTKHVTYKCTHQRCNKLSMTIELNRSAWVRAAWHTIQNRLPTTKTLFFGWIGDHCWKLLCYPHKKLLFHHHHHNFSSFFFFAYSRLLYCFPDFHCTSFTPFNHSSNICVCAHVSVWLWS